MVRGRTESIRRSARDGDENEDYGDIEEIEIGWEEASNSSPVEKGYGKKHSEGTQGRPVILSEVLKMAPFLQNTKQSSNNEQPNKGQSDTSNTVNPVTTNRFANNYDKPPFRVHPITNGRNSNDFNTKWGGKEEQQFTQHNTQYNSQYNPRDRQSQYNSQNRPPYNRPPYNSQNSSQYNRDRPNLGNNRPQFNPQYNRERPNVGNNRPPYNSQNNSQYNSQNNSQYNSQNNSQYNSQNNSQNNSQQHRGRDVANNRSNNDSNPTDSYPTSPNDIQVRELSDDDEQVVASLGIAFSFFFFIILIFA